MRTITICGPADDTETRQTLHLVHELAKDTDVIFYYDADHLRVEQVASLMLLDPATVRTPLGTSWLDELPAVIVHEGAEVVGQIQGFDLTRIRELME